MSQPIGSYHRVSCSQPLETPERWVDRISFASQDVLLFPEQSSVLEELVPTQPYEVDSSPEASLEMDEEGEGYLFPEMRYPPVSPGHDTAYINSDWTLRSVHGSNELFIQEEFILKKHVMRYVDSRPFLTASKVVAITREGKHIVWQQAIRSCVPSAISMMALDRQKFFLAKEITHAVTNNDAMLRYIQKAGFDPIRYPLKGDSVEKVMELEKIIAKSGPGLLHLNHPDLKSHLVVLDEISLKKSRVILRESYHGFMITIKLFPFIDWIGEEFIECSEQKKSYL